LAFCFSAAGDEGLPFFTLKRLDCDAANLFFLMPLP
jgi:hypothetical protein